MHSSDYIRCMYSFICIVLFLIPVSLLADQFLENPPGDIITLQEAKEYGLFSHYADFKEASITGYDSKFVALNIEQAAGQKRRILFLKTIIPAIKYLLESHNNSTTPIPCLVELTTKEVSVRGKLNRWTGENLEMIVEFGSISIPLEKILTFDYKIDNVGENRYLFSDDPNTTRLFFAPTGRSLKKGEGYFSVYEVVFPDVNYAIFDNVSIGGGISPFSNSEFQLYWFTPKVGLYEKNKWAVSAGLLHFQIHDNSEPDEVLPGEEGNEENSESEDLNSFGVVYSVITYGTKDISATLGVGFPYGKEIKDRPVIMIGGEYRLSERTKLISENWLLPFNDDPLSLLGVRWFGKKMAVDFALGRIRGMEVLAIPWVDFVINF